MRQTPKSEDSPVGVGVTGNLTDQADVASDRDSLRTFAAHLQRARDDERASLAQTLHNDFGQAVSVLKLELSALRKEIDAGAPAARLLDTLGRMDATVESMLDTVPRIIRELRPVLLDTLGFDAAARALIAELKRTGLRARFRSDASIRLSADASSVLYRALQEALLNVQRHAKASSIDVTLQRAGRDVILKVADDGRGADSDFERKPGAFGLQSVRERLRVLNGSLTLEPVPSGGTRFIARIPDSSGRSPVATT